MGGNAVGEARVSEWWRARCGQAWSAALLPWLPRAAVGGT